MNPHQLELFYHVAKFKGASRAARQMPYGIQQPSVSAQVNALERDLGVTLYERRPFKLTPAGEELIERYVEAGYGFGLSVRLPGKKMSPKVRSLELPDSPLVKLGVLHRGESGAENTVRRAFLEEVRRQAARFQAADLTTG